MLACVVETLIFECLDLEHFFLVCWYIFGISRSGWCIKVIGSRSKSQEEKGMSMFPFCKLKVLYSLLLCVALQSAAERDS